MIKVFDRALKACWRGTLSRPLASWFPHALMYPRFLSLFLTTKCNLSCFVCRREFFRGEDAAFSDVRNLSGAIKQAKVIDITGWGEATIYPFFSEALNFITTCNSEAQIRLTTNGTKLSPKIADLLRGHIEHIVISLNAAVKETYESQVSHGRPSNQTFKKTLDSIKAFAQELPFGDRKKLQLHFVAHTENFREIPAFVGVAQDLGISSSSVGNYIVAIPEHQQYVLLHVKDEYDRIVEEARRRAEKAGISLFARTFYEPSPPPSSSCDEPFYSCYVGVDGEVSPCCFAGVHSMGNVFRNSFESVWFGESYRALRRHRHFPECRTCTVHIPFENPASHLSPYLIKGFTGDEG